MIGFYNYTVILTYIGLMFSVLGIMETLHGHWKLAILFLVFSGACDMFDGKIARSKKDRTEEEKRFGIQIDSLCDLVCFGVFPALIGYSLGLHQLWERMTLVLYVMAAVIRLGYFNVMEEKRQTETSECRKFYQGLPVTSSAIIFPVVFLCKGWIGPEYFRFVYLCVLAIVGILFIGDFKVVKPGNKAILAFVVVGTIIILKILRVF